MNDHITKPEPILRKTVYGYHTTAEYAANKFADEFSDEGRKVDPRTWRTEMSNGRRVHYFRLVHGHKVYRVECNPSFDGWEIREMPT